MGRGDKKSRKGKRTIGSFGVSRNRKKIKARLKRSAVMRSNNAAANTNSKPKKATRKKAEA